MSDTAFFTMSGSTYGMYIQTLYAIVIAMSGYFYLMSDSYLTEIFFTIIAFIIHPFFGSCMVIGCYIKIQFKRCFYRNDQPMFTPSHIVVVGLGIIASITWYMQFKAGDNRINWQELSKLSPLERLKLQQRERPVKRFQTIYGQENYKSNPSEDAYQRRKNAATPKNEYAESPSWVRLLVGFMSMSLIPIYLIFPSSAEGLSKKIKDMAEHIVNVPMFFRSLRGMINFVDPSGNHEKLNEIEKNVQNLVGAFPVGTGRVSELHPNKVNTTHVESDVPNKATHVVIEGVTYERKQSPEQVIGQNGKLYGLITSKKTHGFVPAEDGIIQGTFAKEDKTIHIANIKTEARNQLTDNTDDQEHYVDEMTTGNVAIEGAQGTKRTVVGAHDMAPLIHTSAIRATQGKHFKVDPLNNFTIKCNGHTFIDMSGKQDGHESCFAGYEENVLSGEMIKQHIMKWHTGYELFNIYSCEECFYNFSCKYNGKAVHITEYIYMLFEENINFTQYFPQCFDLSGYPFSIMDNIHNDCTKQDEDTDFNKRMQPNKDKFAISYMHYRKDLTDSKLAYPTSAIALKPFPLSFCTYEYNRLSYNEDFAAHAVEVFMKNKKIQFVHYGLMKGNQFLHNGKMPVYTKKETEIPEVKTFDMPAIMNVQPSTSTADQSYIVYDNNTPVEESIVVIDSVEKKFQCKGNPFCNCTYGSDRVEGNHQIKAFNRSDSESSNESWNHGPKLEEITIDEHEQNIANIDFAIAQAFNKMKCTIGTDIKLVSNVVTNGEHIKGDLRQTEVFADYQNPNWRDDRGPRPGLDLHPSKFPHKDVQYLFRQVEKHVKNLNKVLFQMYCDKFNSVKTFQGSGYSMQHLKKPAVVLNMRYSRISKVSTENVSAPIPIISEEPESVNLIENVKSYNSDLMHMFNGNEYRDKYDEIYNRLKLTNLTITRTEFEINDPFIENARDKRTAYSWWVGHRKVTMMDGTNVYQTITGHCFHDLIQNDISYDIAAPWYSTMIYRMWRTGISTRGVYRTIVRRDKPQIMSVLDEKSKYYWKDNIMKYIGITVAFVLIMVFLFLVYKKINERRALKQLREAKGKTARVHTRQQYNKFTKGGVARKHNRSVYNAFEDYKEALEDDSRLIFDNGVYYLDNQEIAYRELMERFMGTSEYDYAERNARTHEEEYSDEEFDDDDNDNRQYLKYLDAEEDRKYDNQYYEPGAYGKDQGWSMAAPHMRGNNSGMSSNYGHFGRDTESYQKPDVGFPMLSNSVNVYKMFMQARISVDAGVNRQVQKLCKDNADEQSFLNIVPQYVPVLKHLDSAKSVLLSSIEPRKAKEAAPWIKTPKNITNIPVVKSIGRKVAFKQPVTVSPIKNNNKLEAKYTMDKESLYFLISRQLTKFFSVYNKVNNKRYAGISLVNANDQVAFYCHLYNDFEGFIHATLRDSDEEQMMILRAAFIHGVRGDQSILFCEAHEVSDIIQDIYFGKIGYDFNVTSASGLWTFKYSKKECNDEVFNECSMSNSIQPDESLKNKLGIMYKDGTYYSAATRCNGGVIANKHAFYDSSNNFMEAIYTVQFGTAVYRIEQHQIKIVGGDLAYVSIGGLPKVANAKIAEVEGTENVLLYTVNQRGDKIELIATAGQVFAGEGEELQTNVSTKEGNCGGFYMTSKGMVGIHSAGSNTINYMINLNHFKNDLTAIMPNKNFY